MTKLRSAIKRLKIRSQDRLRYSRLARAAFARSRLLADRVTRARADDPQSVARAIVRLCAAARSGSDGPLLERIEARIRRRLETLDLQSLDWSQFVPGIRDPRISKAAIIKPWVSPREKGVVFVSFEDQWARLLCARDLEAFARRYDLVVAPTWCPPHSLVNVAFPAAYPGDAPIFTLISNVKDLEIFPRLSPRYAVVPLFASSWVNPDFYAPRPRDQRDIDIVMIANFGKYKRHHALFRALAHMPKTVRVMLIGQPQDGRNGDSILAEAALFGVADRVTAKSSVTNEFLADAFCRAKISLIMSRREGSCVAVTESMFADTPVGLLHDAEVGSKAFINDATGRLLDERRLAKDLAAFLDAAPTYSPRQWAVENISCRQSSQTLNGHLRKHALAAGQDWTTDISPLYWRPDPQVLEPTPDLANEFHHAREHLGLEIGTAGHFVGLASASANPTKNVPALVPALS
jgi:glycosyltransferase involved in cell wall biosynthesis